MSRHSLAIPAVLLLIACEPRVLRDYDDAASNAALTRWAEACPGHYAEIAADIPEIPAAYERPADISEPEGLPYRQRAQAGDREALDCRVLMEEWLVAGKEDRTGAEHQILFSTLYVRWRLHDIGWAQLEALASEFPRETLWMLINAEHGLTPVLGDLERTECRGLAQSDPVYQLVMSGRGDFDPARCDAGE